LTTEEQVAQLVSGVFQIATLVTVQLAEDGDSAIRCDPRRKVFEDSFFPWFWDSFISDNVPTQPNF
jgi:hypothetical protein